MEQNLGLFVYLYLLLCLLLKKDKPNNNKLACSEHYDQTQYSQSKSHLPHAS